MSIIYTALTSKAVYYIRNTLMYELVADKLCEMGFGKDFLLVMTDGIVYT